MKDLDIAEVAQRSGVPASTLRFYEEKGLIVSTGRRGLRRLFDPGVVERLALITLGRVAGFSLDEIARMFAPDGRPRIDRQMLAAKAKELDRTIRKHERHARRPAARRRLPRAEPHTWNAPASAVSWGPLGRVLLGRDGKGRRGHKWPSVPIQDLTVAGPACASGSDMECQPAESRSTPPRPENAP